MEKSKKYKKIARYKITLLLLLITIVGGGVRFYGLDRQSLWYDEILEETAFQRQFLGDKTNTIPNTPPFHAMIIYIISQIFPNNDLALRAVPATFGVISIPLLFFLGRRLFNEKIGLIASFCLSISPFHIWYSQEVRWYALHWVFILISLIYFLRTLETPCFKNYIGYVISNSLGLYTFQLQMLIIFLQGLYILLFFHKYKTQIFKWTIAWSIIGILYMPWIIHQITSLREIAKPFPKPVSLFILFSYTFYSYFAGFSIGPSLRELHLNLSLNIIKPYLFMIWVLMFFYGTLIILGLWALRKDYLRLSLLFLLIILPTGGILILISILNKFIPTINYNVRYSGAGLFGVLLSISKGIEWLSNIKIQNNIKKKLLVLIMFLITGFSLYSYINYQFNKKYHKEDIRGAVAYIKKNKAEGDIILCISDNMTFNRYGRNSLTCNRLPNAVINNKEGIEAEMQKIIEGKKRLWLVLSREWSVDKNGYAKAWLDRNYREIKRLHKGLNEIANVQIYCYDLTQNKEEIKRKILNSK